MSDTEKSSSDNGMPEGIPAPPPPAPNIQQTTDVGATYGGTGKEEKKKKKGRSHPTDPYEDVRKKKGCGGCCGCLGGFFALVLLLVIGLVAAVSYLGPAKYVVKDGYEMVHLTEAETIITEAPDKPTFYLGQGVVVYVPESTGTAIAIVAPEIEVSGNFQDDVSLTGAKVTCTSGSTFAKDLEIYAAEFYDKGIELKGELKGRVMSSLQ